jgi:hypothetical protein
VPSAFARAINSLGQEQFQSLYGRWDPLPPAEVARLLAASSIWWYIAGGRAARAGAVPRLHEDTDLVVSFSDLGELRRVLADWHLWEAHDGTLRPLLAGLALTEGPEQLWARRDAQHPWQLDILLDRSGAEWTYKRDASVRLPWDRALHSVDGVRYLRPEVALLHKAHLDRPKDRADLAAAVLDQEARNWLVATLERLGHAQWARLAAASGDDGENAANEP